MGQINSMGMHKDTSQLLIATKQATLIQHYVTILLGMWLVIAIFIDGYAHRHNAIETFFTPWHANLYAAFLTAAVWMVYLVIRNWRNGNTSWKHSIPRGYTPGLWGVLLFLLGGLGDMTWHTIFGIEKDTAALLSPSHLILLVGSLLLLSSPYNAAKFNGGRGKLGWGAFLPVFLSITLAAAASSFFLMYSWMFNFNLPSKASIDWLNNEYGLSLIVTNNEYRGLSYILINTMLLMIPLFLLMKRWTVPLGTITVYLGMITALNGSLDGFRHYTVIVIALTAGLVGDVLYVLLRPYDGRIWAYRIVAAVVPIILWSLYFGWLHLTSGIGWEVELWTGSIVQSALASIAVSLLAFSPKRGGVSGG
ncbi:hypothetical protein I6N90_18095 [Paenibacillus sp. GSMTC-2017]|uniref:hypothetical protein n=1 Tax=Paenibacillus sp. GSMTC-2017 TaxID=2794350 RepID=UPI0018D90836|nr:hypothetical protein [Paenibacillus sp. GSMTC-2017]MBH5319712.1 hypothetical protein [Paenibacillus sp. GSMTC-2017]